MHSHDQCIEAVKDSDFIICILDKRYGSRYAGNDPNQFNDIHLEISGQTLSGKRKKFQKTITVKQLSITWCELIVAQKKWKRNIYICQKQTFRWKNVRRRNQFLKSFKPVYAEKEELYDLIDWITQFDSIVDFGLYFRKWLKEIFKTRHQPPIDNNMLNNNNSCVNDDNKKVIFFVTKGESDRSFITVVLQKLKINIEARFMVTYGKYRMFNNSMDYVVDTGDINAFFIL